MLNDLFLGCRVAGFLEGLAVAKSIAVPARRLITDENPG